MKEEIEVLVRAIVQNKEKILVCQKIGKNYYFFPGGHVESNESANKALSRELKEELGLKIKRCSLIGILEHSFTEEGIKHHEINLVFEATVGKFTTQSKENHLHFFYLIRLN